eukprot:280905-Pleurochrysis_carterae.AAC.1
MPPPAEGRGDAGAAAGVHGSRRHRDGRGLREAARHHELELWRRRRGERWGPRRRARGASPA